MAEGDAATPPRPSSVASASGLPGIAAMPYHRGTPDTPHADQPDKACSCSNVLGIENLDELLHELGYDSEKEGDLRAIAEHEFVSMAGDADASISLDSFVIHASQLWGLDPRLAQAYFFASNVDLPPGHLNKREYLLLRAGFVHCPVEHEVLFSLRLRATFFRYTMSTKSWDEACHKTLDSMVARGTGVPMTRKDFEKWMSKLLQTNNFLHVLTDAIMPKLRSSASEPQVTEEEFMQIAWRSTSTHTILSAALAQASASAARMRPDGHTDLDFGEALQQALVSPPSHKGTRKVVLSDRAISAYLQGPSGKEGDEQVQNAVFRMADVPDDAINTELKLDKQLRAYGDWRGPLAPARNAPEQLLASKLIATAMQVARELGMKPDQQDRHWALQGQARTLLLGSTEDEQADTMFRLAEACKTKLQAEPSLVRVGLPAKVFGDIHGQLRDLLMLFAMFGAPTTHQNGDILNTKYVFDGDYIDRGAHQLEVVAILFALKVLFPSHVFLLRGNHEFRSMSVSMGTEGFLHHMRTVMPNRGEAVFEAIHRTFDWLPIAALIDESVLVLHGGLGSGTWGIKDLEAVRRPLETDHPEGKDRRVVLDAMWADPADSDANMRAGVHINHGRSALPADSTDHQKMSEGQYHQTGVLLEWGADVTRAFCKREGVSVIIRGHQLVEHGYKYMHGGHLITLFSARNYYPSSTNDAAVIFLAGDVNGHLRLYPKRLSHSEPRTGVFAKAFSARSEQSAGVASPPTAASPPPAPVPAEAPKKGADGTVQAGGKRAEACCAVQ